MTELRDTREFQWGEVFERALSRWLQRQGWGILPVYNYSGADNNKPPLLEIVDGPVVGAGLVLPDMLGARGGQSQWFEAKRKTHADYTRCTDRLETGFSLRLYRHYCEVEKRSGLPVWVFFGHEEEDEVRFGALTKLSKRTYDGPRMGPSGMVFFGWDALTPLCTMSELMAGAS